MGTTTDVFVASISAMVNIFIVSVVGYLLAIYPKGNPLVPPTALKILARLSICLFSPALIFYSVSNAMSVSLLESAMPLILFSVVQFFVGASVARCFRCFHDDLRLAKVVEVAVGVPNQISMPVMVMLSMCKSDVVNSDFGGDADQCGKTSMGLVFIFAIGFYVSFWGFGYPQFETLQSPEQRAQYCAMSNKEEKQGASETTTTRTAAGTTMTTTTNPPPPPTTATHLSRAWEFVRKALLNMYVISVYVGIIVAVIPGFQDLLYAATGALRPLGDAIETISDPLVCLNCFIMSGSLALTGKSVAAPAAEEEGGGGGEGAKDRSSSAGDMEMAELDPALPDANRPRTSSVGSATAKKAPLKTIVIHSFLRLILAPLIMILLLRLATRVGIVGKEDRIVQLIIAVEAAAPSAQLLIVSLNELGIQDLAGTIAYMYIPHYLAAVATITGWTTVAGNLIYS